MQLYVRFFLFAAAVESFQFGTSFPTRTPTKVKLAPLYFSKDESKESWNEAHLAHGILSIPEVTTEELLESETAAAWDAHDAPDAGMEAAAEERAVMLAAEMMHEMKEKAEGKSPVAGKKWNEEHLAHNLAEVHEETAEELLESEMAAAWDAHDAPDAGMEAAAEERAVMLAAEMMHKLKEGKKENPANHWNEDHLAHNLAEVHEEDPEELLESEMAAAWDAHDAPDAGMEAAAEERAVMLAAEMVHKMKEGKKEKTVNKWNEDHLAHNIAEVHEEDPEELLESEMAAAWDAHDAPDAGMEAAAEERAVMLAAEMVHMMKEKKARAQKK